MPYMFTGGDDPDLWIPIPSVNILLFQPHKIELLASFFGKQESRNVTVKIGPQFNSFWFLSAVCSCVCFFFFLLFLNGRNNSLCLLRMETELPLRSCRIRHLTRWCRKCRARLIRARSVAKSWWLILVASNRSKKASWGLQTCTRSNFLLHMFRRCGRVVMPASVCLQCSTPPRCRNSTI